MSLCVVRCSYVCRVVVGLCSFVAVLVCACCCVCLIVACLSCFGLFGLVDVSSFFVKCLLVVFMCCLFW